MIQGMVCLLAAGMLVSCSRNTANRNPGGSRPTTAAVRQQEQQTVSDKKVFIRDITAEAGDKIDYIGAIESAENLEINRSMIYVDSSAVNSNVPGIYKAVYTFDYLGASVTSAVKVTVLEKQEKETEQETVSGQEGQTTAAEGREPVTAVVEQELPDAELTLSDGKKVNIEMTSARYITETYTAEDYFEQDGMTFLQSELWIVFNTGEEQVVETVVTRVQPQSTAGATQ